MNKLILTLAALSASVAPQIALAKSKVPVFVEASILELPRIYINGGRRGFLVGIDPSVVPRIVGARSVNVALPG